MQIMKDDNTYIFYEYITTEIGQVYQEVFRTEIDQIDHHIINTQHQLYQMVIELDRLVAFKNQIDDYNN